MQNTRPTETMNNGRLVSHSHHASTWKQESVVENHNLDTTTQFQAPPPHSCCKNLLCPGRKQDTWVQAEKAKTAWDDGLQVPDLCHSAQHTQAWAQLQGLNAVHVGRMSALSRDGWDHHYKPCQCFFFPLFCSSPAHSNSLLWRGEEEEQTLLAEQHRCHILFSSHAWPLIFSQGACCYRWNGLIALGKVF